MSHFFETFALQLAELLSDPAHDPAKLFDRQLSDRTATTLMDAFSACAHSGPKLDEALRVALLIFIFSPAARARIVDIALARDLPEALEQCNAVEPMLTERHLQTAAESGAAPACLRRLIDLGILPPPKGITGRGPISPQWLCRLYEYDPDEKNEAIAQRIGIADAIRDAMVVRDIKELQAATARPSQRAAASDDAAPPAGPLSQVEPTY